MTIQDKHTKQTPVTKMPTCTFFTIIYKRLFFKNRWILLNLISHSDQNAATTH